MLTVAAVALIAAAAHAGCGDSDDAKDEKPVPAVTNDQRAILGTVDALQTASRNDDARKICREIFAESLAKSIAKASKHSCEREVRDTLTTPDARLAVGRGIKIEGSRATAIVREENGNASAVFFVKDGDRWKIERIQPVKS